MNINRAMYGMDTKKWTTEELKAAIEAIRKHKTYGDDQAAQQEKKAKTARRKHFTALLKERKEKP